jgi:hypothetical protein
MPSPGYTDFKKVYYHSNTREFFCSCNNLSVKLAIRGSKVRHLEMSLILQKKFIYICNNPNSYCGFWISESEAEKIEAEAGMYESRSQHGLPLLLRRHVRHDHKDCGTPETVVPCTPPPPPLKNSLLTAPRTTIRRRKGNRRTVGIDHPKIWGNTSRGTGTRTRAKSKDIVEILETP